MASAHNLLGVVNQLQSMENTLTAILIETALKLSSLTDAKVFVLVDSSEGRRFAGASQLCHAYASNVLSPTGNDIEIVLEPNVKTLRERPLFPSDPKSRPHLPPPPAQPQHPQQPQHHHHHQQQQQQHHHDGYEGIQTPRHAGGGDEEGRVEGVSSRYDNHKHYEHGGGGGGSEGGGRKRTSSSGLTSPSGMKVPRLGEYDQGPRHSDDNMSVAGFVPYDDQESRYGGEKNSLDNSDQSLLLGDPGFPYGQDYDHEYEVNVSFVDEFLHDNQKADRVRQILDGSAADKSSVNHKLTMSLLYDFAKCIFLHCPFTDYKTPAFRAFFETSFQKFYDGFPNFLVWEENAVKFQVGVDKKTDLALMKPPKSFIRKYVRNGVSDLKIKKSGRRRTGGGHHHHHHHRQHQHQQHNDNPPPPIASPCNYSITYPNH